MVRVVTPLADEANALAFREPGVDGNRNMPPRSRGNNGKAKNCARIVCL
jgi:hypothetical protein